MSTQTIGSIGQRLDLLIRQGATLGPFPCTMTNPDATPVNLTGATIRGQIRKKPADAAVIASFDVTVTDATAGKYTFGLTATATAAITAGADVTKPESLYVWDMELEDAAGRVTPLFWGDARVHREVTRV
ncbi:MAG: hypothetical protein RL456_1651 [Pseudomonadota bacterium]|jgi:hypothetical protein